MNSPTKSPMSICLIAGLPGSGKTHLAKDIQRVMIGFGLQCDVLDDITEIRDLPDKTDVLIITDVNFCSPDVRLMAQSILSKKYEAFQPNITWKFFENNRGKCRLNVARRNDGRNVEGTLRRYEGTYRVPVGHVGLEIFEAS